MCERHQQAEEAEEDADTAHGAPQRPWRSLEVHDRRYVPMIFEMMPQSGCTDRPSKRLRRFEGQARTPIRSECFID